MVPGLATIAAASFAGTTSLKSISIPSSVNKINAGNNDVLGAFEGSGLESVDLSGTSITTTTNWPNPSAGSHGTFSNMPNLTSVTLPAGLTAIPSYAFYNSPKLKTVKVSTPDQAEENQRAVTGADNTITLPTGLTSLGNNAFQGTGATTVDLSGVTRLTSISGSAFMGMNELTTVKLPASVTTIGASAFANDAKLATLSQANPTSAGETVTHDDAEPTVGTAKFGSSLTTIRQNAFQETGFSVVDLSQTKVKSNISNSSTTGLGQNAFTGLAQLTTVKLPASADVSLANFGGNNTWTLQYGSDSELSSTIANLTFSSNTITDATGNYKRISNPTIQINASDQTNPITLSAGLFNGNSTLTTLKLNRTGLTSSSSSVNDLWAFQLGTAPNGSNLDAAYASAPLGNNSALTNLEFSGFSLTAVSSDEASQRTSAGFEQISETTWSQVAGIMNLFSSWSQDGLDDNNYNPNLTSWTQPTADSQRSKINNWISADLDGSSVKNNWKTTKPSTSTDAGSETIDYTKETLFKYHNEVLWTYKKDTTTNEITLEGVSANLYKATNGGNAYQAAFSTTEGGVADQAKLVNIKLIIVPGSSTPNESATKKITSFF